MSNNPRIVLISGKKIELEYTNRSTALLQSLKHGTPSSKDFKNPKKAFFAVCAWIWATLPKEVRAEYDEPSDLADALDMDKLGDYFEAISACMTAATPSEAGKE